MIKCIFENGKEAQLRHVTVDALVVKNNQVLLVKRAPHLIEGGKFSLPGGFLDLNETTQQGVLRELKEETGYAGKVIRLLEFRDNPARPHDDRQNVTFVYLIEVEGEPGKRDQESTEVRWVELDALPSSSEMAFDHLETIEEYKKQLVDGKISSETRT